MISTLDIFAAGIVPFVIAYLVYWLLCSVGPPSFEGAPLAVAVGFVVGQWLLESRGDWAAAANYSGWLTNGLSACVQNVSVLTSPHVARNWLGWFAVVAAAIATASESWNSIRIAHASQANTEKRAICGAAMTLLAALSLSLIVPIRLLWSSVYFEHLFSRSVALALGSGVILFVTWQCRRAVARDDAFSSANAALTLVILLASCVILATSGSLTYGQHCGALVAATTGLCVAQVVFHRPMDVRTSAGPICVVLFGLFTIGVCYSELSLNHAGLLLLSILLAHPFWLRPKSRAHWVFAGVVALILVAVVWQTVQAFLGSIPPEAYG